MTDADAGAEPREVAHSFARALLDGHAQTAANHFEAGGLLLTADGTEVSGRESIAMVLDQIANSRIDLGIRLGRTMRSGPVALATQFWRRTGNGFDQASTATLVLAEVDRRWAIRIASPFG